MIDLDINYINSNNPNIVQRKNAAEELRAVVYGLAGKMPLEIAVTHMHGDHGGMTGAFLNRNVDFWAGEGEVYLY